MASLIAWLGCMIGVLGYLCGPAVGAETKDLQALLQDALSLNGDIAAAERELGANLAAADKVWTMMGPQIRVQAGYKRLDEGIERFGERILPREQSAASLEMEQPVVLPEFFPRHERSLREAESAIDGFSRRVQEVLLDVAKAYVEVLRTKNLLDQAVQAEKSASENAAKMEALYRGGMVTKDALVKARIDLNKASLEVDSQKSEWDLSNRKLSNLVGLDVRNVQIAPPPTDLPEIPYDVERALELALAHRYDYHEASLKVLRWESERKAIKARFFPTATGRISMDAIHHPRYDEQSESWTAAMVVQWPLLEGGLRWYELKETLERLRQARVEMENKKHAVMMEVREAYADLRDATGRIPLLKDQLDLAETRYQMIRSRLNEGAAVMADLSSAWTERNQAEVDLINGRYDCWKRFYEFQLACGVFAMNYIASRLDLLRGNR